MGEAGFKLGTILNCLIKRMPPADAPPGSMPIIIPYEIQLDEQALVVTAPVDDDNTIRLAPALEASAPAA